MIANAPFRVVSRASSAVWSGWDAALATRQPRFAELNGVFADGRVRIFQRAEQVFDLKPVQPLQGVQGRQAGLGMGDRAQELPQGRDGGGSALRHQQPLNRIPLPAVGMIDRHHQLSGVHAVEAWRHPARRPAPRDSVNPSASLCPQVRAL